MTTLQDLKDLGRKIGTVTFADIDRNDTCKPPKPPFLRLALLLAADLFPPSQLAGK